MNMPSELRQAVEAAHGAPVEIVDGDRHYVLIQADIYERLVGALDLGELSEQECAAPRTVGQVVGLGGSGR